MVRILNRHPDAATDGVVDGTAPDTVTDEAPDRTGGVVTTERVTPGRDVSHTPVEADRPVVADRTVEADRPVVADTPVETGRTAHPVGTDRVVERDRVVEADRTAVTGRPDVVVAPTRARVSFGATLGLIIGLVALLATLTGLLVPVGIVLGVLGLLLSSGGFAGVRRNGVAGHSLALLGLLASAAALVLGVLAATDALSWLSSHHDTVPGVRDWVNTHMSWFKHW